VPKSKLIFGLCPFYLCITLTSTSLPSKIHLELKVPGILIMHDLNDGLCEGSDLLSDIYCSANFKKDLEGWSNLLNIFSSSNTNASIG
jgi:hypothetical protein